LLATAAAVASSCERLLELPAAADPATAILCLLPALAATALASMVLGLCGGSHRGRVRVRVRFRVRVRVRVSTALASMVLGLCGGRLRARVGVRVRVKVRVRVSTALPYISAISPP